MALTAVTHIVDDDRGVRATLRALCRSVGVEAREYDDIADFDVRRVPSEGGCVLLDLRLPKLGGLPGLAHVLQRHPDLPVIVISAFADVRIVAQAMKLGAVDFFQKPFDAQELLDSIQEAIGGPPARTSASDLRIRLETLSRQQREVVRRLCEGKTEKSIAHDLGLNLKTIQRHRKNAAARLHIEVGDEKLLGSLIQTVGQ